MKTIKMFLNPVFVLGLVALIASCNNPPAVQEAPKKTIEPVAAPEVAFKSFPVALYKFSVPDYAKWRIGYDKHDSVRQSYGLTNLAVLRGTENPNMILVVLKAADVQKAKTFSALPELRELMKKAGISGAPDISYFNFIRLDSSKSDFKDRMIITHRVKDFDAWLKVYDAEGKTTRAAEGLMDRSLGRNVDDPNMVRISFTVTDMAKAKAAINSEEKKKLMMSAGVEGMPKIEFFRDVAN